MLNIPEHLEWIYVYYGKTTHQIAYVGRSGSPLGVAKRLSAHLNGKENEWHEMDSWLLYFIPCLNRLESETIEAEVIFRFQPIGNTAKKDWGSFVGCPELTDMIGGVPEMMFGTLYPFRNFLDYLEKQIFEQFEKEGESNAKNTLEKVNESGLFGSVCAR